MDMLVLQRYQAELEKRGYKSDPAQMAAVAALERCALAWQGYERQRSNVIKMLINRPEVPQGVYMHGGVGRGKSFLMDCFFEAVPLKCKVRLHFHEFMREVHRRLHALQGTVNPLGVLGAEIARKYKLICFDEFHIANITDAMVLHRLLDALFSNGVGMVMTSNFAPDALYPDGLHRDRILPAIALLKAHMEVLSVDNGVDYRRLSLAHIPVYLQPLNSENALAMQRIWDKLQSAHSDTRAIDIEGRSLQPLRHSSDVVWFDFKTLCDSPRSQNDYLALAERYHTVLVSDIPQMGVDMASAARRFTWLVDVLYDRKVKLIVSAQVQAEELYTQGPLAHEFVRTVSRLQEMRSEDYLSAQRRDVNTSLICA